VEFSEIMLAWQDGNLNLLKKHSADVCPSKSRTLDELKQQI
jgi:hypothetical protein